MKLCTICFEQKDERLFFHDKLTKDGLSRYCKVCSKDNYYKHRKETNDYCRTKIGRLELTERFKKEYQAGIWHINRE